MFALRPLRGKQVRGKQELTNEHQQTTCMHFSDVCPIELVANHFAKT